MSWLMSVSGLIKQMIEAPAPARVERGVRVRGCELATQQLKRQAGFRPGGRQNSKSHLFVNLASMR